jgi:uncharacterized lipoprotein YmbA
MTRGRLKHLLPVMVLCVMQAACSSPNPELYTIAPISGTERTVAPNVVVLQQIGLARYLERPQIVRSSENYRLDVMSNDMWGEPLAAMLGRILVTELGQRLPRSAVITETGAVSASPDATIALNVQRLDEDASGALVLQALASVTFKGKPAPILREFHFSVTPPSAGIPGEVAAISTAIGQLADGIAVMVVSAPAKA